MRASLRSTTLVALVLAVAAAVSASHPGPSPAHAAARVPQLTATPASVRPGETVTLHGSGFPRNAHVALLAGPPHADATRIGGARTGLRGGFVATIHIRAHAAAGRVVALACLDGCRVKASARFRIRTR